jgi:hypothetical protein
MPFADDIFGDLVGPAGLSAEELRRLARRAERRERYGRPPADVAEVRERAAAQTELARQISEALRMRDVVSARALIAEGEQLFGREVLLSAVELQARQDVENQMAEHYQAPGNGYEDHWPIEED